MAAYQGYQFNDVDAQRLTQINQAALGTFYGGQPANAPISSLRTRSFDLSTLLFTATFFQPGAKVEEEFQGLVEQWRYDIRSLSSMSAIALHPSYQRIMSMGTVAIPLILRDLEKTRDPWLWALHYLAPKEEPAKPEDDVDTAVDAWLAWGRKNGHLR